jgi:Protein of unknown function (DUF1559)
MLDFECPSCHGRCQVADAYAGKSVVCPKCAKTATVPPRDAAATAVTTPDVADAAQQAKAKWRHDEVERDTFSVAKDGGAAWTWVQLCVCGFIGLSALVILVALLWPRVVRVHGDDSLTLSRLHLKEIVLAMHNYQDAYKRLPTNGKQAAVAGNGLSGCWAFQILPFVDQTPAFQNPERAQELSIATYMCPRRARNTAVKTGSTTDYFLNIYVNTKTIGNGWNAADSKTTLNDINAADGTSFTVFVGQGWISSNDYNKTVIPGQSNSIFLGGVADLARGGMDVQAKGKGPQAVLQRDTEPLPAGAVLIPWGGPFKQGALMGMGDGTVRMFPYAMSGTTFGAFLTPTNGEVVELPDS